MEFKIGEEAIVVSSTYGPPVDGTVVVIKAKYDGSTIYKVYSDKHGVLGMFPRELRKLTKLDKALK